jgi:hypothetical protein
VLLTPGIDAFRQLFKGKKLGHGWVLQYDSVAVKLAVVKNEREGRNGMNGRDEDRKDESAGPPR